MAECRAAVKDIDDKILSNMMTNYQMYNARKEVVQINNKYQRLLEKFHEAIELELKNG